jgi:hypothetical protein
VKTRNILIAVAALAVALAVGFGALATGGKSPLPAAGSTPTPASGGAPAALTDRAVAALSKQLGIPPADIKIASSEAVEWSDASLGCPEPDMSYVQVITPGYRIVLQAGDKLYEYHTGAGDAAQVRHCGDSASLNK